LINGNWATGALNLETAVQPKETKEVKKSEDFAKTYELTLRMYVTKIASSSFFASFRFFRPFNCRF